MSCFEKQNRSEDILPYSEDNLHCSEDILHNLEDNLHHLEAICDGRKLLLSAGTLLLNAIKSGFSRVKVILLTGNEVYDYSIKIIIWPA